MMRIQSNYRPEWWWLGRTATIASPRAALSRHEGATGLVVEVSSTGVVIEAPDFGRLHAHWQEIEECREVGRGQLSRETIRRAIEALMAQQTALGSAHNDERAAELDEPIRQLNALL